MRGKAGSGGWVVAGSVTLFVTMLGAAHAGAVYGDGGASLRIVSVASPAPAQPVPAPPGLDESVPLGREAPPAIAALLDSTRELVDPSRGMRIGPLTFVSVDGRAAARRRTPRASESGAGPVRPPRTRSRPGRASRASGRRVAAPLRLGRPRVHADPGRHVIATARAMNAGGVAINGSCYRYLSEVFSRAGHSGWRARRVVYREGRTGPYANLGLLRPGDWLNIVNHPERTPVGTHSVLFVGWQDRPHGIARVIDHSGWGAATAGREHSYDVSRTYRIIRPTRR